MGTEFAAVMTEVWNQFGNAADAIMEKPMLLLPVGVGFFGAIIGVTKKFFLFRR